MITEVLNISKTEMNYQYFVYRISHGTAKHTLCQRLKTKFESFRTYDQTRFFIDDDALNLISS